MSEPDKVEPTLSPRTYLVVCATLLVLTGLTISIATIDLGVWNTPIALFIAATKATLIALFFMHLKFAPPTQRMALGIAILWLAILLAGTLDDYLTRAWLGVPGK